MACTGGRAPPSQNKRLPCAGSRWPAEARGSPLEGLQLVGHVGRNAGPLPAIDLGLLDPVMQRLGVQPILAAIDVTQAQSCWQSQRLRRASFYGIGIESGFGILHLLSSLAGGSKVRPYISAAFPAGLADRDGPCRIEARLQPRCNSLCELVITWGTSVGRRIYSAGNHAQRPSSEFASWETTNHCDTLKRTILAAHTDTSHNFGRAEIVCIHTTTTPAFPTHNN